MKCLFACLASILTGCAAATPTPLAMMDGGCQAQVPPGYQVAGLTSTGTLEVHVVNEQGVLLAKAAVQAIGPNEHYRVLCLSGANAETGGDGLARLDRMKVGKYRISAHVANGDQSLGADAFVRVDPNKATSITLTVKSKR